MFTFDIPPAYDLGNAPRSRRVDAAYFQFPIISGDYFLYVRRDYAPGRMLWGIAHCEVIHWTWKC